MQATRSPCRVIFSPSKNLWKSTIGSPGRFRFHIVLDEDSVSLRRESARLYHVQLASSWNLQPSNGKSMLVGELRNIWTSNIRTLKMRNFQEGSNILLGIPKHRWRTNEYPPVKLGVGSMVTTHCPHSQYTLLRSSVQWMSCPNHYRLTMDGEPVVGCLFVTMS